MADFCPVCGAYWACDHRYDPPPGMRDSGMAYDEWLEARGFFVPMQPQWRFIESEVETLSSTYIMPDGQRPPRVA